jgi:hypothetical protein
MKASAEGQLLTQFFNATRTRNSQFIKSYLDPALLDETEFNKNLLLLADEIPKGEPKSVQFQGWAFNISSSDGRTSTVAAQYDYEAISIIVTAEFRGEPESLEVTSFHIEQETQSTTAGKVQTISKTSTRQIYERITQDQEIDPYAQ